MEYIPDARIDLERVIGPEPIRVVADLAREIWTEHYTPIIGAGQVAYMLDRFQSERAITADIGTRGYQYDLIRVGTRPAGYAAYRADSLKSEVFLSKIYLLRAFRGRGLSSRLLARVEETARLAGCTRIRLTVNKYNTSSIKAYLALGFSVTDAVVTDIGEGYSMDDYVMEKTVSQTVATAGINFRDPFLLTAKDVTICSAQKAPPAGRVTRPSPGLHRDRSRTMGRPSCVFYAPDRILADRNFWAPECHAYHGAFYLFVSFKSPIVAVAHRFCVPNGRKVRTYPFRKVLSPRRSGSAWTVRCMWTVMAIPGSLLS
jgi:GNAT superfamily N-acetyltransferase